MKRIALWFFAAAAPAAILPALLPAAEGLPPLPPSIFGDGAQQSLADIMKTDLLKRLTEAAENRETGAEGGGRPRARANRPSPELGNRGEGANPRGPVDLSKYIGTGGDPEKTWNRLQEMGVLPPSAPAPIPPPATAEGRAGAKSWIEVEPEKRLEYAREMLEKRHFSEGLDELERALDAGLDGKRKPEALALREKLLFQMGEYETVERDWFRLRSYYPEAGEIRELKTYLEKNAGLAPLREAVAANPSDPAAQRALLDRYLKYGWLDFAEEFFAETIGDTSVSTAESLSEIYYRKGDHAMLVKLSRASQKLHPDEAVFWYNEGVGLTGMADAESLRLARGAFLAALRKARGPGLAERADWYLQRLPE